MDTGMPMPERAHIDAQVVAFRDILDATSWAVVCTYGLTGAIIGVNHYRDLAAAVVTAFEVAHGPIRAEVHATMPLTAREEQQWA